MADQIGVAILGCGYWGINYVRVFDELSEAQVRVVCDQREERLREVGQQYPGVALATSVDQALSQHGVDVAVVCTQAKTHYDIIKSCLHKGKHVLVEKPITTSSQEALDVADCAASRNLTLMVGHTFLYNNGIEKVKTYIDKGDIGRVYYLYSRRTNLGPIRHDVNAIWDLAPHDISIFNYLLGRTPEWVSAVGSQVLNHGQEDVGFITLGYGDGIISHIHVSWTDPNKVREVVVVGSNQRILFNDLDTQGQVRIFEKGISPSEEPSANFGEFGFMVRDGDIISPKIDVSEPLKKQCKHFLECVSTSSQPLTDGLAGMEVVKAMESISQSIDQCGAPVQLA